MTFPPWFFSFFFITPSTQPPTSQGDRVIHQNHSHLNMNAELISHYSFPGDHCSFTSYDDCGNLVADKYFSQLCQASVLQSDWRINFYSVSKCSSPLSKIIPKGRIWDLSVCRHSTVSFSYRAVKEVSLLNFLLCHFYQWLWSPSVSRFCLLSVAECQSPSTATTAWPHLQSQSSFSIAGVSWAPALSCIK